MIEGTTLPIPIKYIALTTLYVAKGSAQYIIRIGVIPAAMSAVSLVKKDKIVSGKTMTTATIIAVIKNVLIDAVLNASLMRLKFFAPKLYPAIGMKPWAIPIKGVIKNIRSLLSMPKTAKSDDVSLPPRLLKILLTTTIITEAPTSCRNAGKPNEMISQITPNLTFMKSVIFGVIRVTFEN